MRTIVVFALAGTLVGCGGDSRSTATSPSPPAVLQTITEVSGSRFAFGPVGMVQSVTVQGGPFNDIRFKWDHPVGQHASGSLSVVAQEYLGRPSGLSTTPGFLARSVRVENDEYVFDSSVILRPGKYWFVTDADVQVYISQGNADVYPGGDLYVGYASADNPFARLYINLMSERYDASFRLSGRLTAG